jgi:hypothetical protein
MAPLYSITLVWSLLVDRIATLIAQTMANREFVSFVVALFAFGWWRFGVKEAPRYAAIFAIISLFTGTELVALVLIVDAVARYFGDSVQRIG